MEEQTNQPGQSGTGSNQTSGGQQQGNGGAKTRTPIEQAVDTARDQAGMAAEAIRRGEFIRDAAIDPNASSDDRLIALLSYVSQVFVPIVMPVIVLLSESSKQRPFQRYHAVQSLALALTFMIIGLAAMIGIVVIQIVPFIGLFIGLAVLCLTPVAFVMYFIAMVYYGYQSYQGKRFSIPGLTNFLHDQGWLYN